MSRVRARAALLIALAAAPAAAQQWAPPLDRRVVVHLQDVSLRDALDRATAAAGLRLAYSADRLPLDRRVRARYDSVAIGEVLADLVRGTALEPVPVGGNQIVLAPSIARAPDTAAAPVRSVNVLERVVVTGTATGSPQRSLVVGVDVIDGAQLDASHATTLAGALDAAVPGLWMWEQAPSSLLARYGSIRGASSFGLSYPKIYVDGIEVANPLVVAQLQPEMVEHVEVIRGPQGAALYGADAISGVINIATRHEGLATGAAGTEVRSTAGVAQSAYVKSGAITQTQGLTLRRGSSLRSADFGISTGSVGSYVPGAYARQLSASGGVRLIGSRSTLVGTARYFGEQAAAPLSPVLPSPTDTAGPQRISQYTVGLNAKFVADDRWTHTLVAGVDGYSLSSVDVQSSPLVSSSDSALRAASGDAARASLKVSSVAEVGTLDDVLAKFTFSADHSLLRDETLGGTTTTSNHAVAWRTMSGGVAQLDASIQNDVFVTWGFRMERDAGFTTTDKWMALPMMGAAVVKDVGPATIKVRAAYGKGLRPAQAATRNLLYDWRMQANLSNLGPEEQGGFETGVDVFVGRQVAFKATHFEQKASGLVQQVAVALDHHGGPPMSGMNAGPPPSYSVVYAAQNVGEITNRGWELESSASAGHLRVLGVLSFVDSRVTRTARDYTGDLRPGDRMLEVPDATGGLSASWNALSWQGTLGVTRAWNWINYDRVAIANALSSGDSTTAQRLLGPEVRRFWTEYPGVTRLRASAARDVWHGFTLVLTGDNLLNKQRGEPDNATVLPGRTVSAGLRARF